MGIAVQEEDSWEGHGREKATENNDKRKSQGLAVGEGSEERVLRKRKNMASRKINQRSTQKGQKDTKWERK